MKNLSKQTIVSILLSILFTFFLVFYFVYSSPGTTTIGEDISTTNLNVSGDASISNNLLVSQNSTTTNLFVTNLATLKELIVSQTTTFNGVSYNWPSSAGSNGQVLTTDGSGNLSWSSSSAGISGSGTSNFLAKWTDATTLSTSTLYELNGNIGLNTTTPAYTLDINGTLSVSGTSTLSTTTISKLNNVIIVDGIHFEKTSAGIQAAINSLPSTGGKIFLPAGTYSINSTTTIPSNVWIEGAGASSTILYVQNNSNCSVFANSDQTNGNTNIKISNLKIDGNKSNNRFGYGIYFKYVDNSQIENCFIYNTAWEAIYFEGSASKSKKNIVSHNIVDGSGGIGIEFYGGSHNIITDNLVQNNAYTGIYSDSDYTTIANNVVRNNSTGGGNGGIVSRGKYSTTANNVCENNGHTGIHLYYGDYSVVSGNVCKGNNWYGIRVYGTDYSIIIGNKLHDNGGTANYSGLRVYVSTNNFIIGNSITDTAGGGHAIEITSDSTNNYLSNNYYSGTGASSISDSATTTIYASQLSEDDLIFKTSGNFGFGTTTPLSDFHFFSETTSTISLDSSSTTTGACLKLKDIDGDGYTYCTANNGSLSCTTTPCE